MTALFDMPTKGRSKRIVTTVGALERIDEEPTTDAMCRVAGRTIRIQGGASLLRLTPMHWTVELLVVKRASPMDWAVVHSLTDPMTQRAKCLSPALLWIVCGLAFIAGVLAGFGLFVLALTSAP